MNPFRRNTDGKRAGREEQVTVVKSIEIAGPRLSKVDDAVLTAAAEAAKARRAQRKPASGQAGTSL